MRSSSSERFWAILELLLPQVGKIVGWETRKLRFANQSRLRAIRARFPPWLRMGEIVAQKTKCQPYDANKFKEALNTIRALTKESPEVFEPELKRLCAEAGVVVVFAKELPKLRTSGATWWFNANKAVIQLSLRYKCNDQLWFSFFHEAGHILKHGKKEFFIEDSIVNEKEKEADEFASNFLIPKSSWMDFSVRIHS